MQIAQINVLDYHAGDTIVLDGLVLTGRDRFHKHIHDGGALPADIDLSQAALYHCGPVIIPAPVDAAHPAGWHIVAAGPTTSSREEPYEADLIASSGLRIIIGKGGMGAQTLAACKAHGCIYVQAVGGAAAQIASTVQAVERVDFLDEFGPAEAMWHLRVKQFTGIVGMDAYGQSIYQQVQDASCQQLNRLLAKV